MKTAYLVLSDGTVFEGKAFGADKECIGELVFTTGVVGYLETLTDPCYGGQIVVQTYPLIGNYGVIPGDIAGPAAVKGYVVRELCEVPSNFRSEGDLDTWLKDQGIPGICGIDTRQLTRILRDNGVMNATICKEIPADLETVKTYTVPSAEAMAGITGTAILPGEKRAKPGILRFLSRILGGRKNEPAPVGPGAGGKKKRVTLIDCGAATAIVNELESRGCEVTVVPCNTAAESILAGAPHGVVLSDGPGDPAGNPVCIGEVKKLIGKTPLFGIGLGHQILAIAMGGQTVKLPYGHRGANQPVTALGGGNTYITSQNHGYAVVSESVEGIGNVFMANANDDTCEAVEYPRHKAFSVQFHPEGCTGPVNTLFLYDRFISMMGGKN